MWPAACDAVCRINIGPCLIVRASATSRASHAVHQPSPAANNNKADDASPFALMLAATGAAAAKDQNPAQDKDSQDDKSAADQQQPAASQGDTPQMDAAVILAQQTQQVSPDAKPAKTDDKSGDSIKTDKTAAADPSVMDSSALPPAVLALQQQALQPQTVQPQAAATSSDPAGDASIGAISDAGGAAKPAPVKPQLQPQRQPQAAQAPAAGIAAAATDATDTNTGADLDATAQTDTHREPGAAANGNAAQAPAAQPATANAKPVVVKPATANAKPDSKDTPAKAATAKDGDSDAQSGEVKPAAQAASGTTAPAADKPASQPQHTADNTITAPTLVAPTTPQPHIPGAAAAATVTQHVQVTAQPMPNMPALAVEIAAKSQAGAKQFDIRLDPPELGRVEVRLSIDATGKASAHLTADQPQTLDLLQKDSTSLTQALRDAGLNVSQNGLNFSLRQQAGDTHQGQSGGGNRSAGGRGRMLTASKSLDVTAAGAAYRAPADGRLDIKV
jgi:flagellar hook-length control protein FliK